MEKTLIIFLISEQTIPNVQFANWYRKENPNLTSDLLFLYTSKMEKN